MYHHHTHPAAFIDAHVEDLRDTAARARRARLSERRANHNEQLVSGPAIPGLSASNPNQMLVSGPVITKLSGTNHNETLVTRPVITELSGTNHNETLVTRPAITEISGFNHNQTLVTAPVIRHGIILANHNETLVESSRRTFGVRVGSISQRVW